MSFVTEPSIERQPPYIPKLARAREIIDHRNVHLNPRTRVIALTSLVMELDGRQNPDDALLTDALIVLMPGQPNMTPLDLWLDVRRSKIEKLVHEDPRDYRTDAYDLYSDTQQFNDSYWIAEAKRIRHLTVNSLVAQKTEIAVRLMYAEAEAGLSDPENRNAIFQFKGLRAVQMIGDVALHPHLDN